MTFDLQEEAVKRKGRKGQRALTVPLSFLLNQAFTLAPYPFFRRKESGHQGKNQSRLRDDFERDNPFQKILLRH